MIGSDATQCLIPPPDVAEQVEASRQQFGALCLRYDVQGRPEVLLVTTRETKRWTVPKGWPIRHLSPHKVAEREAWEEAGIKGRAKRHALGEFRSMKKLADGTFVPIVVAVHVLYVRHQKRDFPESTERTVAWMPPSHAARLVEDSELRDLLRKIDAVLPKP